MDAIDQSWGQAWGVISGWPTLVWVVGGFVGMLVLSRWLMRRFRRGMRRLIMAGVLAGYVGGGGLTLAIGDLIGPERASTCAQAAAQSWNAKAAPAKVICKFDIDQFRPGPRSA